MKTLILYGSTGGNTEFVARMIQETLAEQGTQSDMARVGICSPEEALAYDMIIFGSPTYGHGHAERRISKWLWKAKDVDLSSKKAAVFGLGDDKYDNDYNIESATILTDFLVNRGAEIIHEPLKINKSPIPQGRKITDWATELHNKIHS